jgi:hypothetical protein
MVMVRTSPENLTGSLAEIRLRAREVETAEAVLIVAQKARDTSIAAAAKTHTLRAVAEAADLHYTRVIRIRDSRSTPERALEAQLKGKGDDKRRHAQVRRGRS